jgi:hypothetical protein
LSQKGVLALGILISFGFRKKATAGRFTRRPLNLNSHNHNQRDRRRRFYLAILQPGQLRHLNRFCLISGTVPRAPEGIQFFCAPIVR